MARSLQPLLVLLFLVAPLRSADPPVVQVAHPVERALVDRIQFAGQIVALEQVEIRARVTGYLSRITFQPGARVKKGDLLFQLDARPAQVALDRAEAKLVLAQARFKSIEKQFAIEKALFEKKVLPEERFLASQLAHEEARIGIFVAQAEVMAGKVELEYYRISAPIDGRIGQARLSPGNLVTGATDESPRLATLIADDPLAVQFEIDQQTYLHLLTQSGGEGTLKNTPVQVWVGPRGKDAKPREGVIDFVDNQLNPQTRTLAVRAKLPNKDHLLLPGMAATLEMGIGKERKGLLIPRSAVKKTLSGTAVAVWIVNERDVVESRSIKVGRNHDNLCEVESGLKVTDRVIVGGDTVREGDRVQRKQEKPSRQ